jgi:hypothetical protein
MIKYSIIWPPAWETPNIQMLRQVRWQTVRQSMLSVIKRTAWNSNSIRWTKGYGNGTFLSPEGPGLVGSKEGKISLLLTPLQVISWIKFSSMMNYSVRVWQHVQTQTWATSRGLFYFTITIAYWTKRQNAAVLQEDYHLLGCETMQFGTYL